MPTNRPRTPRVCKRAQLLTHPVDMVVKPPGGTKLDFARRVAVLEIAEHRAQYIIILRVKREKDRPREIPLYIELSSKRERLCAAASSAQESKPASGPSA